MEGLTQEERAEVRKTIIALILDTDMAKHFQHTGELEILSTKLKMRGSDPSASSAEGSPLDRDSVMRVMGAIIHMADIGHSLKPVRLHLEWSRRVLSEFFSESTQLRELGHTPLPFMDPLHCHVPTAQIDYLDFVVRPYLFALCEVIPALKPLLSALLSNYVLWADCIAAGRAGGDAPPSEDVLPTSEPEADVRPRAVSRMTSGGRQGGEGMGSRARSRMTSQGGEKMSEERKREMTAHLELYKGVIGDMGVPEPSKVRVWRDGAARSGGRREDRKPLSEASQSRRGVWAQ